MQDADATTSETEMDTYGTVVERQAKEQSCRAASLFSFFVCLTSRYLRHGAGKVS